jgi:hypothetical protein
MKHYSAKTLEFTKEGFTDLFILNTANAPAGYTAGAALTNDFSVGFNAQAIVLTALAAGDAVLGALVDVKTAVVGPTGAPTGQVKTGTGGVAITPTVAVKTATGCVTDNTVVGATISPAAENLVFLTAAGGGDSAAATAGEVWIWAKISRAGRLLTAA